MLMESLFRRWTEERSYRRPMAVSQFRSYRAEGRALSYPVCPRCGSTMEREYQSYCDRCGQRLSWDAPHPAGAILTKP